ncbi:MAG: hypothetical protein ACK4VO_06625 [Pseudobdellovibrio sp.]
MNRELFFKFLENRMEIMILTVWIVVVVLLFKVIPDKQLAGLIAGVGFCLIPTYLMLKILRQLKRESYKTVNIIRVTAIVIFIISAALPVLGLRVFNWGIDFNSLELLGIVTGRQLHMWSNYAYLIMMISFMINKKAAV